MVNPGKCEIDGQVWRQLLKEGRHLGAASIVGAQPRRHQRQRRVPETLTSHVETNRLDVCIHGEVVLFSGTEWRLG
jgi:hypothetical protein